MNNKIEEQFLLAIRLHAQWEELWRPIRGFPNYEVSSRGQIRRVHSNRILKQMTNPHGYRVINLYKSGVMKQLKVHRLVCTAFYPNRDAKPYVDHIDNNRTNNQITNVRWSTHSENGMNRAKHCNNTSGVTGVRWDNGKWRAQIKIDGICKNLGRFSSLAQARRARIAAVNKLFGSFANNQTNR